MVKIIFFDIDGTLISRTTHRVAASSLDALSELRSKNIKLCIATGRGRGHIPAEFLELFDVIISLNGQCAYDKYRDYFKHAFDPDDVALLVDLALTMTVPMYFVTEDGYFVNYIDEQILQETLCHNLPIPTIADPRFALSQPVYSASVFLPPEAERELMSQSKNLEGTRWDDSFFDVVLRGYGKHSALTEICGIFGIDPQDSMAFGDGGNDLSMLREAGIGVAMGNANEQVKAQADYITDDEDHDGIANALRHFGLID